MRCTRQENTFNFAKHCGAHGSVDAMCCGTHFAPVCHAISRNRIRSVDMKSIALNHMRTNGRTGWHVPLRMTKMISFIFHSSFEFIWCVLLLMCLVRSYECVCVRLLLRCFTPIIIHVHSSHRRTHTIDTIIASLKRIIYMQITSSSYFRSRC